jgi:proteasome lid subunit RPN8/RPN11
MKIKKEALYKIINHLGFKKAEAGGALFGKEEDFIIQEYVPDIGAKTTAVTYTIDTAYLNPIVKKLWDEKGYSLLGIIHSHPHGYHSLSGPDRAYFKDLLTTGINREKFYAPIVFTIPDGGFNIFPHVLDSKGEYIKTEEIELINENKAVENKEMKKRRRPVISFSRKLSQRLNKIII